MFEEGFSRMIITGQKLGVGDCGRWEVEGHAPDAPDDPEREDEETEGEPREDKQAEHQAGADLEARVFAQLGALQQHVAHVVHQKGAHPSSVCPARAQGM